MTLEITGVSSSPVMDPWREVVAASVEGALELVAAPMVVSSVIVRGSIYINVLCHKLPCILRQLHWILVIFSSVYTPRWVACGYSFKRLYWLKACIDGLIFASGQIYIHTDIYGNSKPTWSRSNAPVKFWMLSAAPQTDALTQTWGLTT